MFLRNRSIRFSPTEGGSASGGQASSGESGQASQQAQQQNAAAGAQEGSQAQSSAKTAEQYERELSDARKEAAKYRTERNGFEADLKKRTDAELTDTERQKQQAQEATAKAEQRDRELRTERTERAIEKAARKLNIVDEETALALIGSKVEYDDAGKPTNVDALLSSLVQSKPYLVQQASSGGAGNPARPGGGVSSTSVIDADWQRSGRGNNFGRI